MNGIPDRDRKLAPAMVLRLCERYPENYDQKHYDPWIKTARKGDRESLKKVTEWKNPGSGSPLKPMAFSKKKKTAFAYFLKNIKTYKAKNGESLLKSDFRRRAPVWSIFWCHVLFDTPIFDVYTNIAFHFFSENERLNKKNARILVPNHWTLYEKYSKWFKKELARLQKRCPKIDARMLDRALFIWGKEYRQ